MKGSQLSFFTQCFRGIRRDQLGKGGELEPYRIVILRAMERIATHYSADSSNALAMLDMTLEPTEQLPLKIANARKEILQLIKGPYAGKDLSKADHEQLNSFAANVVRLLGEEVRRYQERMIDDSKLEANLEFIAYWDLIVKSYFNNFTSQTTTQHLRKHCEALINGVRIIAKNYGLEGFVTTLAVINVSTSCESLPERIADQRGLLISYANKQLASEPPLLEDEYKNLHRFFEGIVERLCDAFNRKQQDVTVRTAPSPAPTSSVTYQACVLGIEFHL